ncbi:transcriptional regulator GcvA [Pelagibius sp.]|uniref:transcriptional regulator GcvA n=1 Tax=Pelagibius sp. TaxID=1931238 RepID=UPI003BAEDA36
MNDLPPLKSLRVFEAAARHLSFTKAADELCVTQGAVSQQVRVLEEALSTKLFRRQGRELRLTRAGERYVLVVREALRLIGEATAELRRETQPRKLTLSCLPSFAHKWLMPRLGDFIETHPDISLRIHTSFDVVDLARDGIDCAIRHGPGGYTGLFAEILLTEELTPMCSPAIAARLTRPEDLAGETLLRDFGTEWSDWLERAGLAGDNLKVGAEFLDSSMAMQAAIDGRGVILGHTALARDDLEAGSLVAPFEARVSYDCAHWFVCLPGRETTPEVRSLHDWLKRQAAAFPAPAIGPRRRGVPQLLPFD